MTPAMLALGKSAIKTNMLTDTAVILQLAPGSPTDPTEASDGRGGVLPSGSGATEGRVVGATLACRVIQAPPSLGSGEKNVDEVMHPMSGCIIAFEADVDVRISDQVEVTIASSGRVVRYELLNRTQGTDGFTQKFAAQEEQSESHR